MTSDSNPDLPVDYLRDKALAMADSITDLCAEAWDRGLRDGMTVGAQICDALITELNKHEDNTPITRVLMIVQNKLVETALTMPKIEVPYAGSPE